MHHKKHMQVKKRFLTIYAPQKPQNKLQHTAHEAHTGNNSFQLFPLPKGPENQLKLTAHEAHPQKKYLQNMNIKHIQEKNGFRLILQPKGPENKLQHTAHEAHSGKTRSSIQCRNKKFFRLFLRPKGPESKPQHTHMKRIQRIPAAMYSTLSTCRKKFDSSCHRKDLKNNFNITHEAQTAENICNIQHMQHIQRKTPATHST